MCYINLTLTILILSVTTEAQLKQVLLELKQGPAELLITLLFGLLLVGINQAATTV